MATTAELTKFANTTDLHIPTIDYQVGIPAGSTLKSYTTLLGTQPGITFDPATKILRITTPGITLSGYDFSGVSVYVKANDVKFQGSKFDGAAGWFSIRQDDVNTGLVVDHCSFDGLKLDRAHSAFVNGGNGKVTVTYSEFLNAATDAVSLRNGVVDHNYFSGSGYMTGAHADSIAVDGTTGPVSITNNFVDARQPVGAPQAATSAINMTGAHQALENVQVSNNVLLGGSHTVYATDTGAHSVKNIAITNNIIDASLYGGLYNKSVPQGLVYSGNTAGVAVQAAPPVATKGVTLTANAANVGEVLFGTAAQDYLIGSGKGDVLVGGEGRDFLFGKAGLDVFRFDKLADSNAQKFDSLSAFEAGIDKIDMSALDSNEAPLTFIGAGAFSGSAGEVHAIQAKGATWIEADLNGDRVVDFRLELKGLVAVTGTDFIF